MQKQYCREFAESQGWTIIKEFAEKGVSGFKVAAADRDAIQEIRQDAEERKFDILLVFMFDRLGRRDDETPFVVEWFIRNGIEVWSAMEGQQKMDDHIDKLLNYIRYWQASGESLKTSARTKTRLSQIVQEGRFRGGIVPYGYRLEKQGRNLLLTVSNTCAQPMEQDKLPHLFDRFYRTDQSRNSQSGGYGLGLSIAKSIVSAHKGKIRAESHDGTQLSIQVTLAAG